MGSRDVGKTQNVWFESEWSPGHRSTTETNLTGSKITFTEYGQEGTGDLIGKGDVNLTGLE